MKTNPVYPALHIITGVEGHLIHDLDRGDRKHRTSELLAEALDNFRDNRLQKLKIPRLHVMSHDSDEDSFMPAGIHQAMHGLMGEIPARYRPFIEIKEDDLVCAKPSGKPNTALQQFIRDYTVGDVIVTGTLASVMEEAAVIARTKAKAIVPLDLIGNPNNVGKFGDEQYLRWNAIHAGRAIAGYGIDKSKVELTLYHDMAVRPDDGKLTAKPFDWKNTNG